MEGVRTQGYSTYPWPEDTWIKGVRLIEGGPHHAKYVILLDYPADFLFNLRTHMTGDERKLLLSCLKQVGIDPADVYLTFAIPHNVPNREVTEQMLQFNSARIRAELRRMMPERVLVMGSVAHAIFKGKLEVTDINTLRGLSEYVDLTGQSAIPRTYVTYSVPPYFIMSKNDQFRDFFYDIEKWATAERLHPQARIIETIVKGPKQLKQSLDLISSASVVSCDIETSPMKSKEEGGGEDDALSPYTALIDAIGFGVITPDHKTCYTIIVPWEVVEHPKTAQILYSFMFDEADTQGRALYQKNRMVLRRPEHSERIPAYSPENIHYSTLRNFESEDAVERQPIAEGTRVFNGHKRLFVLHNGKFDTQFLTLYFRRHGLMSSRATGFGLPMRDTMLMNYCLDERPYNYSPSPHSLKAIARERYDMPNYKYNWAEFWSLDRADRDYSDMYRYLSDDLMFTLLAYFDLLQEMIDEDPYLIELLDQVLVPATQAFADMQLMGIHFDREHLQKAERDLTQEMETERLLIRDACYDFLCGRLKDDTEKVEDLLNKFFEDFNPRSTTQTQWLLYSALGMGKRVWRDSRQGGTEYTTNKVFLQQVKGQHPGTVLADVIDHLIKYRELGTLRSTFVRGLLKRSEMDGRVHGQFNADGTSTGRTSSQDPNNQNIPVLHGPLIRSAFTVPPGYTWLSVDYSQLEYRVATEFSRDPDMLQVYFDDRDMHREVASKMFGKPPETITDVERFMAKLVGFGSLYGRTAESMAYAPELIGTEWEDDVDACADFMSNMLGGFPGYKVWREAQEEHVRKYGYVVQPTGRKRRFPFITRNYYNHIMRQAVNTPIQGYASDVTVYALIRVHFRLVGTRSSIISVVHDEINVQAHKDEARQIARMMKYVMEKETLHQFTVPIKADVEVGRNWGSLAKWDPDKSPLPSGVVV